VTPEEILGQFRRASSFRTICEVHREIYDLCESLPDKEKMALRSLVIEAFVMGKRMDGKLREYKSDWDSGFYERNVDHRDDSRRRKA